MHNMPPDAPAIEVATVAATKIHPSNELALTQGQASGNNHPLLSSASYTCPLTLLVKQVT